MPNVSQHPPSASSGGAIGLLLGIPILFVALICYHGVHQVQEGHIGLYWRGSALLEGHTEPGFHVKLPITTVEDVQITLQTDTVRDIPCGTSGGTMIYFDKIEVVNRLRKGEAWQTVKQFGVNYDKIWIFDKIHHEINQFCSAHTLQEVYIDLFDTLDEALATALQHDCDKYNTGVEIVAIRVTKPRIPDSVKNNYEKIEEQKTQLMVADQQQRVARKKEETLKVQATINAEKEKEVSLINAQREAEVAKIDAKLKAEVSIIDAEKHQKVSLIEMERQLAEKKTEQEKAVIDAKIFETRQKVEADAIYYKLHQEAEGYKEILTPEYLKMILFQSLSNNTKIFFGNNIPDMFVDLLPKGSNDLKIPSSA